MKTDSSGAKSNPEGDTPDVLVKTCDGRVKKQRSGGQLKGLNQEFGLTVPNFDLQSDSIEFKSVSADGWFVEKLELRICDDATQQTCKDVDVGVVGGSAPFWIKETCNNCDQDPTCTCFKGDWYLKNDGDSWALDNDVSTCDVRLGQQTVNCMNPNNDGSALMTARVKKSFVHDKPSADFADDGDFWKATYPVNGLDKTFETGVRYQGQTAGDYLALSKTVDLGCKNVQVDGVTVCQDVGAGLTWTCRYSLADQVKTDSYTVTGQDTAETADGIGTLNYDLVVLADKAIGETVQFEIRPKNVGLVTADIKHCEVAESSAAGAARVSIIGTGVDNKDKCTVSAISSALSDHSGTGTLSGSWTAFKWSTSDNTDAENQQLSCSIELSENGNGVNPTNC